MKCHLICYRSRCRFSVRVNLPTFLELLQLNVDLVDLDAQIDLEVGQSVDLLLKRTNQVLEVRAKIVG